MLWEKLLRKMSNVFYLSIKKKKKYKATLSGTRRKKKKKGSFAAVRNEGIH